VSGSLRRELIFFFGHHQQFERSQSSRIASNPLIPDFTLSLALIFFATDVPCTQYSRNLHKVFKLLRDDEAISQNEVLAGGLIHPKLYLVSLALVKPAVDVI